MVMKDPLAHQALLEREVNRVLPESLELMAYQDQKVMVDQRVDLENEEMLVHLESVVLEVPQVSEVLLDYLDRMDREVTLARLDLMA